MALHISTYALTNRLVTGVTAFLKTVPLTEPRFNWLPGASLVGTEEEVVEEDGRVEGEVVHIEDREDERQAAGARRNIGCSGPSSASPRRRPSQRYACWTARRRR